MQESNLPQNPVHHPVDAGSANAVGGADTCLLQMLHNTLDEWQLDMLGVLDVELLTSLLIAQDDWLISEDGKVKLTSFANKFYAVGTGALMADKTPRTTAWQSVGKLESGTNGVFSLI